MGRGASKAGDTIGGRPIKRRILSDEEVAELGLPVNAKPPKSGSDWFFTDRWRGLNRLPRFKRRRQARDTSSS